MQDLFGGSSSSQSSVSQSGPVDVTPPEFKALRGPIADALRGFIGGPLPQGGGTFDPSTSSIYAAPITSQEAQYVAGLAPGADPLQTASQNYINKVLSGAFLPGGSQANPFLQATIQAAQRPTLQGLYDTLSRTLPGRFTANGQFIQPQGSSAFDTAAALATGRVSQTLGDIATNIAGGAYNTERQLQQGAVPLQQADVQSTISKLQASALPRLISQYGIDQGLKAFQDRIRTVLSAIQIAEGLPLTAIANQSTSASSGQSSESKGLIPGLSGAFGVLFPKGIG